MKLLGRKEQQIAGFFDQGTGFTGELQFSGVVRIDGNFHGSINSGDKLIVGVNAVIHADIRVREIEIHGHVVGNIEASVQAEIQASGTFRGDIATPILTVHKGAKLEGHSHMITDSDNGGAPFSESTRLAGKTEHIDQRRTMDRDPGHA
jgi:cytoskeletal protein CcmA (bactofilin family)